MALFSVYENHAFSFDKAQSLLPRDTARSSPWDATSRSHLLHRVRKETAPVAVVKPVAAPLRFGVGMRNYGTIPLPSGRCVCHRWKVPDARKAHSPPRLWAYYSTKKSVLLQVAYVLGPS